MLFFSDEVFSQYVEKLKETNLPVKENKVYILSKEEKESIEKFEEVRKLLKE